MTSTTQMRKKVFVSGCYDMLHSGHVAFFEEAASHGDVYVGLGSDATVYALKGRKTINTEQERLYMVKALKSVTDAWVNSGSGLLDFEEDVRRFRPDIFFVNEDGQTADKEVLCKELGIEYRVSQRIPHGVLPARSTTSLRKECSIPYRIDLAGGWLDQPYVSKLYPGPVITICIEPDYEFNDRSGMSTSTRKRAIELWQTEIPTGDREKLARTLFCYENPPGTAVISGSQDSLGIVCPGLNRLDYEGGYWPVKIAPVLDADILQWLEDHIYLVALPPRVKGYDVLSGTHLTPQNAQALSEATDVCWDAILRRDIQAFGSSFKTAFEAQLALFPNMAGPEIMQAILQNKGNALGWKLSGAGGGGYIVLIAPTPADAKGIKIRIRRTT